MTERWNSFLTQFSRKKNRVFSMSRRSFICLSLRLRQLNCSARHCFKGICTVYVPKSEGFFIEQRLAIKLIFKAVIVLIFHLLLTDMNWWLNAGGKIQLLAQVSRSWSTEWKLSWQRTCHTATWASTTSPTHITALLMPLLKLASREDSKVYI